MLHRHEEIDPHVGKCETGFATHGFSYMDDDASAADRRCVLKILDETVDAVVFLFAGLRTEIDEIG